MAYLGKRFKTKDSGYHVDITALADVTMCLLVIFLVSASVAVEMVKLSLPEADNTISRDINLAVTMSVNKDGEYFFEDNSIPIEAKNLWVALRDIKADGIWGMVLIRADKDVPSTSVALVVQCFVGLGVGEIAFVTQK